MINCAKSCIQESIIEINNHSLIKLNNNMCSNIKPFVIGNTGLYVDKNCDSLLMKFNFFDSWDGNFKYEIAENKNLYLVTNLTNNYYKENDQFISSITHTTNDFTCEKIISIEDANKVYDTQFNVIFGLTTFTFFVGLYNIIYSLFKLILC